MQKKKGQITIFIILGLVILIAVGFFYYISTNRNLSGSQPEKTQILQSELDSIRLYMEGCMQESVPLAVQSLARSGLYYDLPADSRVVFSVTFDPFPEGNLTTAYRADPVPFYIIHNTSLLPTEEQIASGISLKTVDIFESCIDAGTYFGEMGFSFNYSRLSMKAELSRKDLTVTIVSPVIALKNDSYAEINGMSYKLDYPLMEKFDVIRDYVSYQANDTNYLQIGYLTDLAYRKRFNFTTDYISGSVIRYDLIFNDYKTYSKEPLVFSFLAEYPWNFSFEERRFLDNYSLSFDLQTGYQFNYTLNTTKEGILFYDYTDLFDINMTTGAISFTPEYKDSGNHSVLIRMVDNESNSDYATMVFSITHENMPPQINSMPDMEATRGVEFIYDVNATDPENDTLLFVDSSDLFDINPLTGIINFTPQAAGYQKINISVVDIRGGNDFETFYLRIKNE